jgi:hypothetical protein
MNLLTRSIVALVLSLAGGAVQLAMFWRWGNGVEEGPLVAALVGAAMAGVLAAPLFGRIERPLRNAVGGALLATLGGGAIGGALFGLSEGMAVTGLVVGPLFVADTIVRSFPVTLVWIAGMTAAHFVARWLRRRETATPAA